MEASSVFGPSSSSSCYCAPYAYIFSPRPPQFFFNFLSTSSSSKSLGKCQMILNFLPKDRIRFSSYSHRRFLLSSTCGALTTVDKVVDNYTTDSLSFSRGMQLPKIDKSGKFCSPRAARELALLILYAACLEGSDPVRLFEKRINTRREPGYEFDKNLLMEYNHMSFGGPPVAADSIEEAHELLHNDEKDTEIEVEVLSASPKLVYSKLILRFTRNLLVAVVKRWDCHVLVVDKVTPNNWKNEPAGRILEISILHLAMSEITVLGTRHQIVINEAVDLAKRYCDGAAPRIVNGCLRTFVKDLEETGAILGLKGEKTVFS